MPDNPGRGDSHRRTILLVEDNPAAGKGLSKLLEAYGFEVTVVSDGESALNVLRSETPPDILLTDLQLPDLDGREVARQARLLDPPPRIVLITGWDISTDPEDVARWGIDCVFSKPLDVRALVAKIGGSLSPPSN